MSTGTIWMRNEDGSDQSGSGNWNLPFYMFVKCGTKDLLSLMVWNVDYERKKKTIKTLGFLAF